MKAPEAELPFTSAKRNLLAAYQEAHLFAEEPRDSVDWQECGQDQQQEPQPRSCSRNGLVRTPVSASAATSPPCPYPGHWILPLALGDASRSEFQTVPAFFSDLPTVQMGQAGSSDWLAWVTCPTCPWQGEVDCDTPHFSERGEALLFTR